MQKAADGLNSCSFLFFFVSFINLFFLPFCSSFSLFISFSFYLYIFYIYLYRFFHISQFNIFYFCFSCVFVFFFFSSIFFQSLLCLVSFFLFSFISLVCPSFSFLSFSLFLLINLSLVILRNVSLLQSLFFSFTSALLHYSKGFHTHSFFFFCIVFLSRIHFSSCTNFLFPCISSFYNNSFSSYTTSNSLPHSTLYTQAGYSFSFLSFFFFTNPK